jgi:hypothetical protein
VKKFLSTFAVILVALGLIAAASDIPVKFASEPAPGNVPCDFVGQLAVDIVGGSGSWVCRAAGSPANSLWESLTGAVGIVVTTEEAFERASSGDLTGGRTIILPPGTMLEGVTMAPTVDDNADTLIKVLCEGGSGFTTDDSDLTCGGHDTVGLGKLEEGIGTLRDMAIDDAPSVDFTFAVTCAACDFVTKGFEVGKAVSFAGFATTGGNLNGRDFVLSAVDATSLTVLDPSNIVTADVAANGTAREQAFATRCGLVDIDWTSVGHDAEFAFDRCQFTARDATGDVGIRVRHAASGNGGRITVDQPTAQKGWIAGDSFISFQNMLAEVNTKVLDPHIEVSALPWDFQHLTNNVTGYRLDIEGGFVVAGDAATHGPCVDSALSNDIAIQSITLELRMVNHTIQSGCKGIRVGGGSVLRLDILVTSLSGSDNGLAGYIVLNGGGTVKANIVFTGPTTMTGAERPFFFLNTLNTAASVSTIDIEMTDRRCGWFSAGLGGQLIGGNAAATGGLNAFSGRLTLGPACTRHATFIDSTPMATVARGTVEDYTAGTRYMINGATSPAAFPLRPIQSGADPATCFVVGELFIDTDSATDAVCTTGATGDTCRCTVIGTPGTWVVNS